MVTHPGEGMKEVKLPPRRKLSHRQVFGEFWNLRRQHNWGKTNKQNKTKQNKKKPATHQICPTVTASGEVTQKLVSATSM